MSRHILVTGASGFIGLALCKALAGRGDRVTALDMHIGSGLSQLAEANKAVVPRICEITEWSSLVEIIKQSPPDGIIHCAAIVGVLASVQAPLRTMQVNVEGSINLFEAARLFDVKRIIHMSSEETYGHFQEPAIDESHAQNPLMPYGISKLTVEHLARSYQAMYGTEITHMRTCWVYGPGLPRQRVPKIFVDAAVHGTACHLPWGADMVVDHTYIDDVVDGVLLALDQTSCPHDAYNLGSGAATRLADMVDIVKELVPGADISAGPGEYAHGFANGSALAVRKGALIVERARRDLGYVPKFTMKSGLAAYIEATRKSGDL
ncbi:MAG: NAD(P)-dependent oxidoreductase [Rhodospirillales bacterium]|nr:NAD(P)-dependent oxidoreductase [Rhodospirillales bacterium]